MSDGRKLKLSKELTRCLLDDLSQNLNKGMKIVREMYNLLETDEVDMEAVGTSYMECLMQASVLKNIYEDFKATNLILAQSGVNLLVKKKSELDEKKELQTKPEDDTNLMN